jgi:hypothetical protein
MEIPTELVGVSTIFAVSIQTGFKFKLKKCQPVAALHSDKNAENKCRVSYSCRFFT